ncbi:hypothetical protein [Muriicola soli]|uniref:Uncharacterized protein n=1 Tax=Muriicola soli TaxID=2507538 RepID=A0A411E829_9FLAO|nr:hypothetical protein [Muriicola soli]QBA63674.1 hypothetical protein EQY75_03395 [Muriicola soli]
MNNLIVGQVVRSAFLLFGVTFFFQSNQLLGQPSLVDYDILAQELNIDPRTAEAAKSAVNFFRVIIDRPEIFPEALDSIKSFEVNDKETAQNLLKETDYLRAEIQIQSANIRNDYFMAVDAAVQTLFQELEIADLNITNDPNADALIVNTAQMLASDLIKNGVKRKLLREKFKVERELDSLLDNKITPLKNKVIENIEANKQNYLEAAAYVSEEHAMRTNYNNYLLQECILEFMNKNYSPWSSEWLEHDCKNDLRYFSSSNKDSSDFQIAIRKLEWHEKTEIPLFKKSAINYLKRSLRKNPKSKEAWYLLYKNSEDIFLKHEFINYAFLLDPNKYEREFKNSLKVTHNFIQDLVSMDSIGFETNKKNFDIIKSIEEYNQAEYLKLAILADSPKFTNFLISYMIQENDLCNNQDLIFKEDSYQVFDLFLKTCEFDHVSLINNLINNHSKNCLKYLNRLYPDLVANFFKENDLRVETLKVAYKYNLIAKDKMPSNLLSELKISFNNIDSIFINEKYLKKNTSAYVLKMKK